MTDCTAIPPRPFVVDLSLALINRTGAYHVCRQLVEALPQYFQSTRYWRFILAREPGAVTRRALAKAMLFELSQTAVTERLPLWNAGRTAGERTLFLDPLYVLHSHLEPDDIVLCHDIGPVSVPSLYEPGVSRLYHKAYDRISRARPGVVFVSEASRDEFIGRYGRDFAFLDVIPLYVRAGSVDGEASRPAAVQCRFLLTVGALETRKNYLRSIEAFTASGLAARGYSYVFCGPRANQTKAVEDLARRTPGVLWLGFVTEQELRWLYRNAAGFVLPSLLEGFGLPALEAAQHGLLSIVSHDGALPEAVGGGAILVDPLRPDDIARGMRLLVDMADEERRALLQIAQGHAAELTFERYLARWAQLLGAS